MKNANICRWRIVKVGSSLNVQNRALLLLALGIRICKNFKSVLIKSYKNFNLYLPWSSHSIFLAVPIWKRRVEFLCLTCYLLCSHSWEMLLSVPFHPPALLLIVLRLLQFPIVLAVSAHVPLKCIFATVRSETILK